MAYTSDLRIKNIIKDVDSEARLILARSDLDKKLFLRIFDESNEDAKLWNDGGLSFNDPETKMNLGSNDAGWFIDDEPLVIIEGTFGTERGQFGDGQLNRVSHSLGVAINGYIGITLSPYCGQSFIKEGKKNDILSGQINFSNGLLHKGMVSCALNVSDSSAGKFLIIDPYEEDALRDLIVNAVLDYYNKDNSLEKIVKQVLLKMKTYLGDNQYGQRSKQTINNLLDSEGNCLCKQARFYTHNLEALTTSTKRDGHGLLGKNLIEIYSTPEKIYSIFIRLTDDDLNILKARKAKEFSFLLGNPKIVIKTFDDLIFSNEEVKRKIIAFRSQNIHKETEKNLISEIQKAFNSGEISIKN